MDNTLFLCCAIVMLLWCAVFGRDFYKNAKCKPGASSEKQKKISENAAEKSEKMPGKRPKKIFNFLTQFRVFMVLFILMLLCGAMYCILPISNLGSNISNKETAKIQEIQSDDNVVYFKLDNGQVWTLSIDNAENVGEDKIKSVTIRIGDNLTEYYNNSADAESGDIGVAE